MNKKFKSTLDMRLTLIPFLSILLLTGFFGLKAQEIDRTIPKEAHENTAPFLFNDSVVKAGEAIYLANCKSCHGDPGKGNYAKLDPIPKDPVSAEYQKNTDGDMFHILSNGRGLMPTFQSTLTEEKRWAVIGYVRSFNKDYVQPPVKSTESADLKGKISMEIKYDSAKKLIIAHLKDISAGKEMPLINASVKLFVKRTFGNLQIGQAVSNSNGVATIVFPENIPGDSNGLLTLIATASAAGKQISISQDEKIGVAINPPLLLDQRAWWNVRSKSPLWIVIAYVCGGIAVACSVLYVGLQLKKIKEINQIKNTSHE